MSQFLTHLRFLVASSQVITNTNPAYPHTTGLAVYLILFTFKKELKLLIQLWNVNIPCQREVRDKERQFSDLFKQPKNESKICWDAESIRFVDARQWYHVWIFWAARRILIA